MERRGCVLLAFLLVGCAPASGGDDPTEGTTLRLQGAVADPALVGQFDRVVGSARCSKTYPPTHTVDPTLWDQRQWVRFESDGTLLIRAYASLSSPFFTEATGTFRLDNGVLETDWDVGADYGNKHRFTWVSDDEFELGTSTDELPQACPAGYKFFVADWKK